MIINKDIVDLLDTMNYTAEYKFLEGIKMVAVCEKDNKDPFLLLTEYDGRKKVFNNTIPGFVEAVEKDDWFQIMMDETKLRNAGKSEAVVKTITRKAKIFISLLRIELDES